MMSDDADCFNCSWPDNKAKLSLHLLVVPMKVKQEMEDMHGMRTAVFTSSCVSYESKAGNGRHAWYTHTDAAATNTILRNTVCIANFVFLRKATNVGFPEQPPLPKKLPGILLKAFQARRLHKELQP